jgi:hypothetical protein
MANLQQLRSKRVRLDDGDLDELFEIYLRPLRSKNARSIYTLFLDEKKELTTLDLQERLVKIGIYLSKKEINAWLRSLQSATLISKRDERGKPTTIEYNGRYSFDMWSLTRKGWEMAEVLEIILTKGGEQTVSSLDAFLGSIDREDVGQVNKTLEKIEGIYILLASIRTLWSAGHSLGYGELERKITPFQTTLDEVILSRSAQKFIEVKADFTSPNIVGKILRYLGIFEKGKNLIYLTSYGRRLSDKLWGKIKD